MSDSPKQTNDFLTEDCTFTFRVNSELKKQFADLCKKQRTNASAVIKLYMEDCLADGYIRSSSSSARARVNSRFAR